jgi:hypothetical protein
MTGYEVSRSYVKVPPDQQPGHHSVSPLPVREEFAWFAKRTHGGLAVYLAGKWHGKLWKNQLLPGVSLWIDMG